MDAHLPASVASLHCPLAQTQSLTGVCLPRSRNDRFIDQLHGFTAIRALIILPCPCPDRCSFFFQCQQRCRFRQRRLLLFERAFQLSDTLPCLASLWHRSRLACHRRISLLTNQTPLGNLLRIDALRSGSRQPVGSLNGAVSSTIRNLFVLDH